MICHANVTHCSRTTSCILHDAFRQRQRQRTRPFASKLAETRNHGNTSLQPQTLLNPAFILSRSSRLSYRCMKPVYLLPPTEDLWARFRGIDGPLLQRESWGLHWRESGRCSGLNLFTVFLWFSSAHEYIQEEEDGEHTNNRNNADERSVKITAW